MKNIGLGIVFLFPLAAVAQESRKGFSALAHTPATSIEELRKDPDKHLGQRVKLTLVFSQELDSGNPYFTRFTPNNYARFAARSGAGPLWAPEIFGNEFQHLFLARESAHLAALRSAKSNQRFEATAIVRDNFRGLPWLELVDLKLRHEWVPEGTLIAVARGKRLREEGQRHLALEQFERALVDPLPEQERAALLAEIASLREELKN